MHVFDNCFSLFLESLKYKQSFERNRVRNTKTVDYAALCNSDDSDDDFVTNKKQQSKVANPTRLPRVSKLKLPVKAVESPNEKKVEQENNFTKLRTASTN